MADIFVSYSRRDRDRIKLIAERLESLGHSVSWDSLSAEAMERECGGARAVLAAWSAGARDSTVVIAQAASALDASKLAQVRLDRTAPPAPFDALPVADMSGERAEWGPLEDALARIVRGEIAPKPAGNARAPIPAVLGAPRLVSLALAAAMIAYIGALFAANGGALPLDQLRWALVAMLGVGSLCAVLSLYCYARVLRAEG